MNEEPTIETIEPKVNENEIVGPVGIGGWLILPAIGLILSPILNLITFGNEVELLGKFSYSDYHSLITFEVIYLALLVIFQIYTAFKFYTKKMDAPKLVTLMLIVNFIGTAIIALWLEMMGNLSNEISMNVLKAFFAAAVWVTYFKRSLRVMNTFVN